MNHIPFTLERRKLLSGSKIAMKFCSGRTVLVQLKGEILEFSLQDRPRSVMYVPAFSASTSMPFEWIGDQIPGIISVFYRSFCEENTTSTNAAGTVIISPNKGLIPLPDTAPNAETFPVEQIGQLVVSSVEKSPFGVPCAAQLNADDLSGAIAKRYHFPSEPIIIEGWATTAAAGRFHYSVNVAGRRKGTSFGYIPFLYPWVSPDGKRHGWALSLTHLWEIYGMARPPNHIRFMTEFVRHTEEREGKSHVHIFRRVGFSSNLLKDRIIKYDPFIRRPDDELFLVVLGRRRLYFQNLDHNEDQGYFSYKDTVEMGRALWEGGDGPAHCFCRCTKRYSKAKK